MSQLTLVFIHHKGRQGIKHKKA